MRAPHVDCDIVIVGGGPVGAALALALRGDSMRVTVLEARANVRGGMNDPRPIALSYGSRLLLERLGAWQGLAPTPINHIHVSQRGGFGRVALSAADAGVPELGYVVDYNTLFRSLSQALHATHGDCREGARATALHHEGGVLRIDYTHDGATATLTTGLVVIADGGLIDGDILAPPTTIDYAQHALTARVGTTLPHNNVAYERFTHGGPLALLPFGEEMSLVWTLTPARAEELKTADTEVFLTALRETFGGRLGAFTSVYQRACYPLTLRYTRDASASGVVTIGNAAQTLHPVAGQGFNLGLRDAWELAQALRGTSLQALRDNQTLRRYRAHRSIDRNAAVAVTHGLVRLFSNDFFPVHAMRGAGMTLLGCVAPMRNFLARRMIFGAHG